MPTVVLKSLSLTTKNSQTASEHLMFNSGLSHSKYHLHMLSNLLYGTACSSVYKVHLYMLLINNIVRLIGFREFVLAAVRAILVR